MVIDGVGALDLNLGRGRDLVSRDALLQHIGTTSVRFKQGKQGERCDLRVGLGVGAVVAGGKHGACRRVWAWAAAGQICLNLMMQ
eukprot:498176-Rhodomonas_salina.1